MLKTIRARLMKRSPNYTVTNMSLLFDCPMWRTRREHLTKAAKRLTVVMRVLPYKT